MLGRSPQDEPGAFSGIMLFSVIYGVGSLVPVASAQSSGDLLESQAECNSRKALNALIPNRRGDPKGNE